MATPHLCRSNPEIFCDGSSYINTALDELPNEISNFLNIPDTLFNMQSGRPDKTKENQRSKCSGFRKCCMNVALSGKKELQPGKNTNCEAKVNFRLENPVAKNAEQRKDKKEYPSC